MPLVAQSAGVEAKREARVGLLRRRQVVAGMETGAAVRCGENAVGVESRRSCVGAFRQGPLSGRLFEQGITQAGDIEVATARGFAVLVPDRFRRGVGEQPLSPCPSPGGRGEDIFQPVREVDRDPPVVTRLAEGRQGSALARDAAFRIGHRAVLLAPGGGGQQQVRIGHGLGAGVALLDDDEIAFLQGRAYRVLIGQGVGRVGADDPKGLEPARLEHLHGGEAWLVRHALHAPQPCHLGAVHQVGQVAMCRQQRGHAADFAPAHGIGLAGERERPGAGPADLAGSEMQIDERGVLVRAVRGLVETLAIERQRRAGGEPARGGDKGGLAGAAQARGPFRGVGAHAFLQGGEALGVRGDVVGVDQVFPEHDVQQAVEQGDVRAGQDGEVQVGFAGRVGETRVDHDHLHVWVVLACRLDAPVQHRVSVRGV